MSDEDDDDVLDSFVEEDQEDRLQQHHQGSDAEKSNNNNNNNNNNKSPINKKKRGAKMGSTRNESRTKEFWFSLCEIKDKSEDPSLKNCSNAAFLRSDVASEFGLTGSKAEQVTFSQNWRLFKAGKLKPTSRKRKKKTGGGNNGEDEDDDDDDDATAAYQPYSGAQPAEALPALFIPQALLFPSSNNNDSASSNSSSNIADDARLWVPQTEQISFRPLCLCVSGGYYVVLLRVRRGLVLRAGGGLQQQHQTSVLAASVAGQKAVFVSRHRHAGPVHGFVIKGSWRYLERDDYQATEGTYFFEPPGRIHTMVVPAATAAGATDGGGCEMITLFHVTGSLLHCDEKGTVVGADDVFTKLDMAKKHYEKVGLGEDFVQQFVR